MGNKTVSVILPNYNYARYIPNRISEILNQTYQITELVILDDASTDDSIAVIEKEVSKIKKTHPTISVKTIFNTINSGNVFSQWKKGVGAISSDYFWICELDDSSKSTFLEEAMSGFDDDEVVLSYTNSKFVNQDGKIIVKDSLRKIKDRFRRNLLVYNTIPNVSAVVFKNQPCLESFLEDAKKFKLSGDWLFYIKVSQTGKIAFSNKSLNIHRLHKGSVTTGTDYKQRFAEMQKIHRYVFSQGLADDKTKRDIFKMEKKISASWSL